MSKAEEYLKKYNIPNIKWTAYINSQDEVKEGMDFPYSIAEVMELFFKEEVNAISDEDIETKISELAREVEFPLNSPRIHLRQVQRKFKIWYENKLLRQ